MAGERRASGDPSDGTGVRESHMSRRISKPIKIALILAVAAVAIAAKQFTWSDAKHAAQSSATQVAPAELMQKSGPLPETKVDSYY